MMLICFASANGHTEVVNVLLADSRVNPSERDNEAIQCASRNGHTEVVNSQTHVQTPVSRR